MPSSDRLPTLSPTDPRPRKMRSEGWAAQEIAVRLGVTRNSVDNWLRVNEPRRPGSESRPPLSVNERTKVAELRMLNLSAYEIANRLGLGRGRVERWITDNDPMRVTLDGDGSPVPRVPVTLPDTGPILAILDRMNSILDAAVAARKGGAAR